MTTAIGNEAEVTWIPEGAMPKSLPRRYSASPLTRMLDAEPTPLDLSTVTLAGALDAVDSALNRYVHFTKPEQSWAITLWVAGTYALDHMDTSARLAVMAPTKQSGKTRLLTVLSHLCRETWGPVIGPSEAVMFRKIDQDHPTLLLDEVDRLYEKRSEDVAGITGVIDAGHDRAGFVPRVDIKRPKGEQIEDFHVYGAMALAGIGKNWPDTILDRAIIILLEKRKKNEVIADFDRDVQWFSAAIGDELGDLMAATVQGKLTYPQKIAGRLRDRPDQPLPESLSDRQRDGWRPLLAIAELAGSHWPNRGRQAAEVLSKQAQKIAAGAERQEVQLLNDIVSLIVLDDGTKRWGDSGHIPSAQLAEALIAMQDRPWADFRGPSGKGFSAGALAEILRVLDLYPKPVHGQTKRGYSEAKIMAVHDRIGTTETD